MMVKELVMIIMVRKSMKESGEMVSIMVKERNMRKMLLYMMENGLIIILMVKVVIMKMVK